MTDNDIKSHTIPTEASVKDALDAINELSGRAQILFAIDGGILKGSVTDGDIRRAFLNGATLDTPVLQVMNTDFTAISHDEERAEKIAFGKRKKLKLIPVTENGSICEIIDLKSIKAALPLDAVMMAGGRGERLRPLTLTRPKPLLEVAGTPIIDRNIEELENYGISRVFVTVNYLHEQIEEHFGKRNAQVPAPRAKVECVLEPTRLGTLGSLSLVKGLRHENLLVMNSDLLTSIRFDRMWEHHLSTGAVLTVGAVPYSVSVPYAIMHCNGTRVTGIEEKPTFNYFANGGVYMMRKDLLSRIPEGTFLDAPDFISKLVAEGLRVELFPIEGRWIDIGNPNDFRAANELLRSDSTLAR